MRNFCWEGNKGSKLNNLVKWDLVTKSQGDEGLSLDKLKVRSMGLLAKWWMEILGSAEFPLVQGNSKHLL